MPRSVTIFAFAVAGLSAAAGLLGLPFAIPMLAMLAVGMWSRTALLALVPPVFVFLGLAVVGVLSYWIPVVMGFAAVGFYGLTKLGRQGA